MDEKEIIIPQFGLETGELAGSISDNFESGRGLISRDEITVIIYEVDGLYLTEEEYYAYLQEQSEVYQSQLDAYNEAVSQAQTEARMKADEFVASLRPDVSDRVEDYVGSHLGRERGKGAKNDAYGSLGQDRQEQAGGGHFPRDPEGIPRVLLPVRNGILPVNETAVTKPPLPAARPELPPLFREDEISHNSTQALRSHSGLSGASALPGLAGYNPGQEDRDPRDFTDRWRGWPERKSIGYNRIISGMLFEPGE